MGANIYSKFAVAPFLYKKVRPLMDGWMDGWMGGWVGGRAGLRIACSNQKLCNVKMRYQSIWRNNSHLSYMR